MHGRPRRRRASATRRRWCSGRPTTTAATRPGCASPTAPTRSSAARRSSARAEPDERPLGLGRPATRPARRPVARAPARPPGRATSPARPRAVSSDPTSGSGQRAAEPERAAPRSPENASLTRLRTARAGRPVNARVIVVALGGGLARRRGGGRGGSPDSGQARKAVPTWAAPAPSASAAASPRPSAIPPAAITGTRRRRRPPAEPGPGSRSGRRRRRPGSCRGGRRPRRPGRSPRRRRASCSRTASVDGGRRGDHPDPGVAERLHRRRLAAARSESWRRAGESRASPRAGRRRTRSAATLGAGGSPSPFSAYSGVSSSRARSASSASRSRGGEWQKKLTLKGASVAARTASAWRRSSSGRQHRRAEGAEAARRADRDSELRSRGAGHRRLQDRPPDSQHPGGRCACKHPTHQPDATSAAPGVVYSAAGWRSLPQETASREESACRDGCREPGRRWHWSWRCSAARAAGGLGRDRPVFDGESPAPSRATACASAELEPARSTTKTFDGVPIDVNVAFPPEPAAGTPDGNYPLMMMFHGYGGGKLGLNAMQPLPRPRLRDLLDDRPRLPRVLRLGRLAGCRPGRLRARLRAPDRQPLRGPRRTGVRRASSPTQGLIDPQRIGAIGRLLRRRHVDGAGRAAATAR